jgi:hypothetical protein
MKKATWALALVTISFSVFAEECLIKDQFLENESVGMSQILKQTICETTKSIKTQAELENVIKLMMNNQRLELANTSSDRHQVAEHLIDCSPEKDSKALVINFAGTGSFNPKSFDLMTDFLACFAENKLASNLNTNVFMSISYAQQKYQGQDYRWDGIQAGPLNQFFSDPYLKGKAKYLDFATFASEESELIANPDNLSLETMAQIPLEIANSTYGVPTGIRMAMRCAQKYLAAAKVLSIKPKIIVLTHSSGGRSAVKFAENLKYLTNPMTNKKDYKIDLVFSMDPVKEAHEAIKEVASQYAGRALDRMADYIPFVDRKDKPINVWTREQPYSLYKPSNTSRWVNVYQNNDKLGLKGPIQFGIHGSPIANADYNSLVTSGLGDDAHGAITFHSETIRMFKYEMHSVLGP